MSEYNIEEVIQKYVSYRNLKKEMEKELEESLKPINEALEKLEAYLLARMGDDNVESYKTSEGTAYKVNKTSCSIADSNMYKKFILEPAAKSLSDAFGINKEVILTSLMDRALWSLTDFRALKKGVEEFIEDNKSIPPGLNVTRTTVVNVRSR